MKIAITGGTGCLGQPLIKKLISDEIEIQGYPSDYKYSRVVGHLDRIRKIANIKTYAKVISKNS